MNFAKTLSFFLELLSFFLEFLVFLALIFSLFFSKCPNEKPAPYTRKLLLRDKPFEEEFNVQFV